MNYGFDSHRSGRLSRAEMDLNLHIGIHDFAGGVAPNTSQLTSSTLHTRRVASLAFLIAGGTHD